MAPGLFRASHLWLIIVIWSFRGISSARITSKVKTNMSMELDLQHRIADILSAMWKIRPGPNNLPSKAHSSVSPLMLLLYELENQRSTHSKIKNMLTTAPTAQDSPDILVNSLNEVQPPQNNITGKNVIQPKIQGMYYSLINAEKKIGNENHFQQGTDDLIDRYGKYNFQSITALKVTNITTSQTTAKLKFNLTMNLDGFNNVFYELALYNKDNAETDIIHGLSTIQICSHFTDLKDDVYNVLTCSNYTIFGESGKYGIYPIHLPATNTSYITIALSIDDSHSMFMEDYFELNTNSLYGPNLVVYEPYTKKSNIPHNKRRRKKRQTASPLTQIENPGSSQSCQLKEWYIDFETLGWDDWFIKPDGYYINYCTGSCASPLLNEDYNASMHAFIKDLWIIAQRAKQHEHETNNRERKVKTPNQPITTSPNSSNTNFSANAITYIDLKHINFDNDDQSLPEDLPLSASCVPIEYEPLSVLYIEDSSIILKHINEMSASRCGCR